MEMYALFEEVSDQYGTSRLVGIYDTSEKAIENESKTKRSYIQVFVLNEKPNLNPTYIRRG